jgi:hypothetical protein
MSSSPSPPARVATDELDLEDHDQYLEFERRREAQDQARIDTEDGMHSDSDYFA